MEYQLIGPSVEDDGIIPRFLFGTVKMVIWSLFHLLGYMYNHGKIYHQENSEVLDRLTKKFIGLFSEMEDELGELVGEEKVFDTWMDSSNSNLFVSGYVSDSDLFDRSFPTSLRPQGKEIVRTWLYYTLLKSTLLLDKPGFKKIWIDGLGMDPWGRKMSKSLGNGIDADSVLECGNMGRTGSWKIKGPDLEKQLLLEQIKLVANVSDYGNLVKRRWR